MPNSTLRRGRAAYQLPASWTLGFAAVLLFFLLSGALSYINLRKIITDVGLTTRTHDSLTKLSDFLSLVKDAETGQRGFIITGDDRYLAPYELARARVDARLTEIQLLMSDSPTVSRRFDELRDSVAAKMLELSATIQARRDEGPQAANALVATDRGKEAMDSIRRQVEEIEGVERRIRADRMAEMNTAFRVAVGSVLVATLLGVVLTLMIGYTIRRTALEQRRREWLQRGAVGLGAALAGDQHVAELGENVLKFLAEYLDAQAAAFFVKSSNGFDRVAAYGVPAENAIPARVREGDGLLWQAAKDRRTFVLDDVPDGYLTIGSGLGRATPSHLVVAPMTVEGEVVALLELGRLHTAPDLSADLIASTSDFIGRAVKSARYRAHLQDLLEETQRQAEELQAQAEELRVSNEELDEQSSALRESQALLEEQQNDLEQSNTRLEEHTQLLSVQRDDLARAKSELTARAHELERASQYKSDFLANMSHELRTPLNSTLILAKLLADNPQGNLTDEQRKFAQTIQAAGNDLLNLINDILDLSKIEAGHLDIQAEPVPLASLVADLRRVFEPIAQQKRITLRSRVAPGSPGTIETDRLRLEQVLKNLLSNAIKFTGEGEVALDIAPTTGGRVAFAVTDTGIGIPEAQQEMVFEAFRQADGTTNRKYGGTGLGLSIARELTRLLGGELSVSSEPGQGSTFTVSLPPTYDPALVRPRADRSGTPLSASPPADPSPPPASPPSVAPAPSSPPPPPRRHRSSQDDRESLVSNGRVILVVEDDERFAAILHSLAHDLGFQCLIAATAEEAITIAIQYIPSAIVLDLGLPDHSGLTVLDRLKRDARTRHIPIHVVSGTDHSETAFSLGAAGYLLKPVDHDQLVRAIGQIQDQISQRTRRVLVVEDDAVQLMSLRNLLGSADVETVGASTAADCLDRLRSETFDCMVLDLSLPDASGYTLLETLSREDRYSFPPVIVYTGRVLTAEEEQRLRRFSKSIIIKGAMSPERLLDEVTLFLHQVVSDLPAEQRRMLEQARSRDAILEGRRILVVEDDVRNVFALASVLEPRGAIVQIARNGREALEHLEAATAPGGAGVDLVLMDVMMPEMDGLTATREIRKRPEWASLPVIMLTAKAMKDDHQRSLDAGANDYLAKPLDVEKLLSLVRVWMPR